MRGLPMFSTLLGFGVGLIALSLWRRGFTLPQARRVLVRRYAFLALFGALHGLLLFHGDIMFLYGVGACVVALMIGMRNSSLRLMAYVMLGISMMFGLVGAIGGFVAPEDIGTEMSMAIDADSFPALLAYNGKYFGMQILSLPFFLVQLGALFILGFVWAREGMLADVASHRRELWVWTVIGAVVAVGCGLPLGLSAIGVLPPEWEIGLFMVNAAAGVFTGPAILAFLSLALDGLQQRVWEGEPVPAWLVPAIALGKRSMSGYLAQSFIFAALCFPFIFGLDVGPQLDAFGMLVVAFVVWLVTLLAAWALEVAGKPGPFEWAHRRLAYGPTGRAELPAGSVKRGSSTPTGQSR